MDCVIIVEYVVCEDGEVLFGSWGGSFGWYRGVLRGSSFLYGCDWSFVWGSGCNCRYEI